MWVAFQKMDVNKLFKITFEERGHAVEVNCEPLKSRAVDSLFCQTCWVVDYLAIKQQKSSPHTIKVK